MPINSVTTLTQYFKTFCVGKPRPAESWFHTRRARMSPCQSRPNKALNRTRKRRAPVSLAVGLHTEPRPSAASQCLRGDVACSIIWHMNTAAKLLEAMRRNPLEWQLSQLQTVAKKMTSTGGTTEPAIASLYDRMARLFPFLRVARSNRSTSRNSLILWTEHDL